MIIYNSTWSILIQYIWIILSGDNLTYKTQKKDPFTNLHKIKANLLLWAEFEILRNGASRGELGRRRDRRLDRLDFRPRPAPWCKGLPRGCGGGMFSLAGGSCSSEEQELTSS